MSLGIASRDVLWGSFVKHSFLGEKCLRDERTFKDVCGETRIWVASTSCSGSG